MGIRVSAKTKKPASLKLYNAINSYLFEQEYDELKGHSKAKSALVSAKNELSKIIKEQ